MNCLLPFDISCSGLYKRNLLHYGFNHFGQSVLIFFTSESLWNSNYFYMYCKITEILLSNFNYLICFGALSRILYLQLLFSGLRYIPSAHKTFQKRDKHRSTIFTQRSLHTHVLIFIWFYSTFVTYTCSHIHLVLLNVRYIHMFSYLSGFTQRSLHTHVLIFIWFYSTFVTYTCSHMSSYSSGFT